MTRPRRARTAVPDTTRNGFRVIEAVAIILAVTTAGCALPYSTNRAGDPKDTAVTRHTNRFSDKPGRDKLEQLSQELDTLVRDLAAPYPDLDPRAFSDPTIESCKDIVGNDPWPQQASTTLDIPGGADTRQQARDTAERLRLKGWTIEDLGPLGGPDNQFYRATRAGFLVQVGGGKANPTASLVILATTPCINRDGTPRA